MLHKIKKIIGGEFMSSIDDLKNNGRVPGTSFRVQDVRAAVDGVGGTIIKQPTSNDPIETEEETRISQPRVLSMTSGAPIKREERVAADLSSLPEKESPIIVKKESLQHEIFKEGGIFDKYKQEKTEEMKQFVEERNLESELQDDTTKADKPVSKIGR